MAVDGFLRNFQCCSFKNHYIQAAKKFLSPLTGKYLVCNGCFKKHVLYLDYLQPDLSDNAGGSLGKQSPSTLRLTLCQCCQCLCNAGQKSIMSKLISCKRKTKQDPSK